MLLKSIKIARKDWGQIQSRSERMRGKGVEIDLLTCVTSDQVPVQYQVQYSLVVQELVVYLIL